MQNQKSNLVDCLWTPTKYDIENSQLNRFMDYVGTHTSKKFSTYSELYDWSVTESGEFWECFWNFAGIISEKKFDQVLEKNPDFMNTKWFPGAKINFAENLLRFRDEKIAILFYRENGEFQSITYKELYEKVSIIQKFLIQEGVRPGDRVGAFIPNIPEAIIGMLATVSLGALWSSTSPDFGIQGVLDRFIQIEPKILFAAEGYSFKGKDIDCSEKILGITEKIPGLKKTILVPYQNHKKTKLHLPYVWMDEVLSGSKPDEIHFDRAGFDRPVYAMFSSGTTGLPKCMVQGPGVLINHLKELILHTDLQREDRLFYFTTCGWMMWNWLVSTLGVGATVVLFDGNPFHPGPQALWEMADRLGVTVFGTSARYISSVESAGYRPADYFKMNSLKAILSTGSPLLKENYDFVYQHIKPGIRLSSISGGTDLNGCFALGNPILPVFRGELQCRGLGMKVEVFNDSGKPVLKEKGELVCTEPFPSQPLFFWNDADGSKYKNAYFDKYPGVWRHGDYAEITSHGGMVIYGRSDATLNPGGVRIGTADLYRMLEGIEEIDDSVAIGQPWKGDERIILFIKMKHGKPMTDSVIGKICGNIRNGISPRHVPSKIIEVKDIPYTLNMKKVELAVKKTILNEEVTNKDALLNPESLENFKNLKELEVD